MNRGNQPDFIAADVENRQLIHLIGIREDFPQLGKGGEISGLEERTELRDAPEQNR
jgi:hypothetical protein